MIPNRDKNKERMRQSTFIRRPTPAYPGYFDGGNPEAVGLHQNWRKNHNKRKKRR